VAWLKKPGDIVKEGEPLADIESDKATIQVEAYVEGTVLELLAEVGDWIPIGAPIMVVGEKGESYDLAALGVEVAKKEKEAAPAAKAASTATPTAPSAPAPAPAPAANGGDGLPDGVRASPLARKVAEEWGIDVSEITGSGPLGRITRADVESFKEALASAPAAAVTLAAPTPAQPMDGDQQVPTPRLRARIAERMTAAKQTVPHFYVTTEIDMAPALELRKELNNRLESDETGIKISVNDMIVKAAAVALTEFPNINASFNGDTIVQHARINVGIAVAVEGGLLNVVSKDADKAPLRSMAVSHKAMIDRAREGKVKPDDIEGETFAVSNLGAYEVDNFIAIINPPAAGILAVGSAKQTPIVTDDGKLAVGWRMKATISADHRVTDGAEAAQFLQRVKEILEDPLRLLM
jgi:pyruvate dehydrogenase E2 component (dihydrolipoamide acetyltransferase)